MTMRILFQFSILHIFFIECLMINLVSFLLLLALESASKQSKSWIIRYEQNLCSFGLNAMFLSWCCQMTSVLLRSAHVRKGVGAGPERGAEILLLPNSTREANLQLCL